MLMRTAVCILGAILGACLSGLPAAAQDNTQPVPPPAPVTSAPLGALGAPPPPPGVRAVPANPAPAPTPAPGPAPGAPQAAAPDAPAGFAPAPAPPVLWVPRGTAEVQALDKVNARNATLSVKVGQSATFGSLTIAVQACVVTAPDQKQDAAAFLVITDSHAGEPGFSGWMIADAPSVSMLQNPIYDVRVTGCRT
jgi:hypothetical protein